MAMYNCIYDLWSDEYLRSQWWRTCRKTQLYLLICPGCAEAKVGENALFRSVNLTTLGIQPPVALRVM